MADVTRDALPAEAPRKVLIYRHPLVVRLTHWANAAAVIVLLLSGLQIFMAHPSLYFGEASDFDSPVLSIGAVRNAAGELEGRTTILGRSFDTTGFLGVSAQPDGRVVARAFPWWMTLPQYRDLATGRVWHFFFAWVLAIGSATYLLYGILSRHIWRDLVPSRPEIGGIGRTIRDHLRLRFHHEGEAARHYNVLQKLAYLGVATVLLPTIILAGLAMSPGANAFLPGLTDFFGGRQSARTIHFIAAALLLFFLFVHLVMVLVSGVWNNLRSMITGRYAIRLGGRDAD